MSDLVFAVRLDADGRPFVAAMDQAEAAMASAGRAAGEAGARMGGVAAGTRQSADAMRDQAAAARATESANRGVGASATQMAAQAMAAAASVKTAAEAQAAFHREVGAVTVSAGQQRAATGATAGSTIVASGLPAGITINGAARTWSYDGSGAVGAFTLTEALGDSPNSPRVTNVSLAAQAPTSPPVFIPANQDVIAVGTSIIENGVGASLGTAGLTRRHGTSGIAGWVYHATGGRLRLGRLPNFGIGGSSLAQIIAEPRQMNSGAVTAGDWFRGSTSTEKSLSVAKAHPAGWVLIEAFTNDNGTAASDFQNRTLALLNALTDADPAKNKHLIVQTPTANGKNLVGAAGSAFSTGMSAGMKANIEWLKTLDSQSGHANARPNVTVVDNFTPTAIDPNGSPR